MDEEQTSLIQRRNICTLYARDRFNIHVFFSYYWWDCGLFSLAFDKGIPFLPILWVMLQSGLPEFFPGRLPKEYYPPSRASRSVKQCQLNLRLYNIREWSENRMGSKNLATKDPPILQYDVHSRPYVGPPLSKNSGQPRYSSKWRKGEIRAAHSQKSR